jgi:hypothetical protein
MSKRPARITQTEIECVMRAAKKHGAPYVTIKIGNESAVVIPIDGTSSIDRAMEVLPGSTADDSARWAD